MQELVGFSKVLSEPVLGILLFVIASSMAYERIVKAKQTRLNGGSIEGRVAASLSSIAISSAQNTDILREQASVLHEHTSILQEHTTILKKSADALSVGLTNQALMRQRLEDVHKDVSELKAP